ncbi:MAG: FtsX-like permease family protein [Bacilli bacterium]|nr:FtsX-like permease family protein [Bacilli bacterium]
MVKVHFKNSIKSIIKSRRRFLSILIMAFLGVGFFSGLKACGPDMKEMLDNYVDNNKMYDIKIQSTLGLTDDDLKIVRKIDNVLKVFPSKEKDSLVKINNKQEVAHLIPYDDINIPHVVEGRLPKNNNECVIDKLYNKSLLGKYITIDNKKIKIVGYVESPLYMSTDRGTSLLGNGTVALFIYVNKDFLESDYYTSFNILVKDAKQEVTSSKKYNKLVDNVIEDINKIKKTQEEKRYESIIDEANNKIKEALELYTNNKQELDYNYNLVSSFMTEEMKKEFEDNYKKLEEAKEKIDNEKEKLDKISKGTWYIQKRKNNTGYTSIIEAIQTIDNIANMFPIIFYMVAILISLTSMTRMIEEERIEIGTLKSLGYTNLTIMSKYLLYSFLACIIGGVLGMSLGFYLLPGIVWKLYSLFYYAVPGFVCKYRLLSGIIGTLFAFICIGGATYIVANSELKEQASQLMRPKAPKNGKKILLENIPFIWKHFNFSNKVTTRNIFRYKKRSITTIIGISGCTALLVTGFGIKDSVVEIPNKQFKEIIKYDSNIILSNDSEIEKIVDKIKPEIYVESKGISGIIESKEKDFETNVVVFKNNTELNKVYDLKALKDKKKLTLDDEGIIITDKIAKSLNKKINDNIKINIDGINYKLKIKGITKNYVGHYIYMNKKYYESTISKYETNMLLVKGSNAKNKEILKFDSVSSINRVSKMIKNASIMFDAMNYVVILLIIASALLDFVVLYNLANVNISERQREIATLKVLGFYDKEVDDYINKENIIFTIIGIILGMVFGIFIIDLIVASIEIDNLRIIRYIKPISFVYSALITITFSFIVNIIIHFILKKINMIESLKSIE